MKKTVLLIQPGGMTQTPRIPLNFLPIAYTLKEKGFEPKIIDLRLRSLEKYDINWDDVLIAGLGVYTGPMILEALEIAKKIREKNREIAIVWGGIHPSLEPAQTAEHELVDAVVRLEGEETMPELAEAVQKGKEWEGIKGLAYRDKKTGKVVSTPEREWYDMNKIPILPYEMLEMDKYNLSEFPMCTSRGCPFGCIFCYNLAFNKRSYRWKDAKLVVDEMEYVKGKYNVGTFMFSEDNFFANKKRVEEICNELIRRKMDIKWIGSIRADYLARYSDEFMQLIKDSGCIMLTFGAESGNDRILKVINKGTTVQDNLEAVKKLKKFDIVGRISFVWGTPTETYEESIETLEFIKELHRIHPELIVNGFFISTVYPNTPLYAMAKKMVPDMEMPKSLEEWGHWMHYTSGFQPWLDRKYMDRMTTASEIVRFHCLKDMDASHYFKNPLKVLGIKAAAGLMNIPASIRWKHNWYGHGIEWRIFSRMKFAFLGTI